MADINFAEAVGDVAGEAVTRAKRSATQLNNRVKDKAGDLGRSVSRYVRDNGPREMLDDVKGIVRAHPGKSLLVVAALAFLIGRVAVRRRRDSSEFRRGEALD